MAGEFQMSIDDRAFVRGLNEALVDFRHDADDLVQLLGDQVAERARQLAPRGDTDDLVNSINNEPGADARGPYVDVGSKGVYYALFVEYGTYKMKAEPFMRPALAMVRGELTGEGLAASLRSPRVRAMVHRARVRNKVRKAYQSGRISETQAKALSAEISTKLRYRARRSG